MARTDTTLWQMEPHTRAKHDLLRRYLGGWFAIMGRRHSRVVFFDGFAGPGVYAGGEIGSPLIALETLISHRSVDVRSEYVLLFNEYNADRFQALEASLAPAIARAPQNVMVEVRQERFSGLIEDILDGLGERHLAPTFAFVDPFGYKDISMEQLRRFLSFRGCELFIYFDYNSANRFATGGVVDDRFIDLFGTDEFKNAPPARDPRRKAFLHDLYERQLKQVCGFEYVQSFEMVTSQNRTGHYLFFCTRSVKGLTVMKEAMWTVDPTGEYRFADYLDGQAILFGGATDTSALQRTLSATFHGKTIEIDALTEWIVINTPYAANHVKTRTLKPMQTAGRITSPNQRQRGTYPSGTLITFL